MKLYLIFNICILPIDHQKILLALLTQKLLQLLIDFIDKCLQLC